MEVHAHTHTARKKWSHYFWEFFMLFLAIFCGFLAENMREHSIEHKREKKFMRAMVEDLLSDSIMLTHYQAQMAEQGTGLDTLIMALNQPLSVSKNLTRVFVMYLQYGEIFYLIPFNENTYSQLKVGGLRLIRNDSVQGAIYEYDKLKRIVTENTGIFFRLVMDIENNQANHLFDFTSSPSIISLTENIGFGMNTDSLIKKSEKDSHILIDGSPERIGIFRNNIRSLKSLNANLHKWTKLAMKNNISLRQLIIRQYHLK